MLLLSIFIITNTAVAENFSKTIQPLNTVKRLPGMGSVHVTAEVMGAPEQALSMPILAINGVSANQQRQVAWGSTWRLDNLPPGLYYITGVPVKIGDERYAIVPTKIYVREDAVAYVVFYYQAGPTPTISASVWYS